MGKYNFQMDLNENTTTGKYARIIAPGSTVLEFGCAEGRMTRYMQQTLGCEVYIVEMDKQSFEQAVVFAKGGICCDAQTLAWKDCFRDIAFDYIMFSDVLEHLSQPDRVMKAAGDLLKEDGQVLVSIPNIGHGDVICSLLCNRFHYTDVGLLDSTHVHFWGRMDFIEFAQNCGFSVVEEDADYLAVNESEQAAFSRLLPTGIRNEIASYPYADVYEFVFTLRKRAYAEKNRLTLVSHIRTENLRAANMIGQLFFDTGSGYSNQECCEITVNQDGYYSQRVKLPPNCKSVRFDPMEGITGCVWDVFACTPDKTLAIQFTNGKRFGRAILFRTTDPQIEFEPLDAHADWIELRALVMQFDGPAWVEICEQIAARDHEMAGLKKRLDQSEAQQASTEEELGRVRGELNRVEGERDALCIEMAGLKKRLDQSEAQQASTEEELGRVRGELNLVEGERDALCAELSRVAGERDALCIEQQNVSVELAAQKERYMALLNRQNELSLQLTSLQESYNAIADAQLWKMTAPLRKMLDAIKKTRFGYLTHRAAQYCRTQGFVGMVKKTGEYIGKRHGSGTRAIVTRCDDNNAGEVYSLQYFLTDCEAAGEVFGRELLNVTTERVLLVSHELNLTGAPIALLYFAQNLKRKGMAPVFIAPRDDKLRNRIIHEGIPVITVANVYESDLILKALPLFRLVIVNTIVGAPLIQQLSGTSTPVLWWIHEAKVSYHPGMLRVMPDRVEENIHIYCMGKQSEKWLRMYRPDYTNETLLYCQPDFSKMDIQHRSILLPQTDGKTVFLMVGMIEERKGQDILVDAINLLPESELQRCLFIFVGHRYYEIAYEKMAALEERHPDSVTYLGEVAIEEMPSLYQSCDCLICPSRDDTGPITVTEAMVLSKIVICSANTGNAALLEANNAGLIYQNDDPEALSELILYVAHNRDSMEQMRRAARRTYEEYFSESAFNASVTRILSKLLKGRDEPECLDVKVSVIVPVYNGGDDLKRLFEAIKNQLGLAPVEMVIVDSGSTDGSAEYAENMGAKVIRIPQSAFSHSHARNLGAENAEGDYLLIMTQDACPDGPYWIRGMLRPVLNQGVAAVSCQEVPRPGCDLLGRVNIFNHSSYMGILEGDRILQMPEAINNDTLRKNAQLNDVACLIRKDVFDQYHYRRNYAEDLDLGLRLIKDGYKLALLSSVQVVHSHTRSSMYHFKRGIVDVSTLNYVLPGSVAGNCPEDHTINRILTAYCVVKLYVRAAQEYRLHGEGNEAWRDFCVYTRREVERNLQIVRNMGKKKREMLIASEQPAFDSDYKKVMLEMLSIGHGTFDVEPTTVNEICCYIVDILSNYFAHVHAFFTASVKDEICVLAEKLTGLCGGNLVGTYAALHEDVQSELNALAKKYSSGV